MGGLAERINPDEQALVFSSGRSVYAFAYGRAQCIATRPGNVMALKTHEGRLLDAGNYEGVRDTLEGNVVLGNGFQWTRLAEHDGRIVGTGCPIGFKPEYGISDVESGKLLWRHMGTTTLLANVPFLINAGDYTEWRANFSEEGPPYPPNFYSRHTYRGRIIWRWLVDGDRFGMHRFEDDVLRVRYRQVVYRTENHEAIAASSVDAREGAALEHDGSILIAKGSWVGAFEKDEKTGVYKSTKTLFSTDRFKSDKLLSIASELAFGYRDAHEWSDENLNKRKNIWAEFCRFLTDNYDDLPREAKLFSVGRWGPRIRTKRIMPMPFDRACKEYAEPIFHFYPWAERSFDYYVERGVYLQRVLETVLHVLNHRHDREYAIRAMAKVNGVVLVGGKRIEALSEKERAESEPEPVQFPVIVPENAHPIEAMAAVPIEIYDDGIKQRVLERTGQRAAHAKAARRSARLRRVA